MIMTLTAKKSMTAHPTTLKGTITSLNNGISKKECDKMAKVVSVIFADTYLLYVKTQNFHWNVTGPLFPMLHLFFEKQYEELADAADELAERIRSLGCPAPGSFSEFSNLTTLKEAKGHLTAHQMVTQLLADHEHLSRSLREGIALANSVSDDATADLLIKRLDEHEKTAWMLRSTAEHSKI
jgi:starvation-inducible DNA-binding protein